MDLSIRVAVETILDQLKPNIAGEDPKNVIVSPASLDILLRTVACGARGKTLDQLLSFLGAEDIDELNSRASSTMEVLRLASPENKPPVIEDVPEKYRYRYETEDFVPANVSCANAIWIDEQHSVKDSFKKLLSDVYRAETNNVDFRHQKDEAVKKINSWAKKSTNGCIDNFLNPEEINEDTPLVLTNAIYFKALWEYRFLKCSDYDIDDFYLIDGTNTVEVPFMSKWNRSFNYAEFEKFSVLELPYQTGRPHEYGTYKGPQFSMYIFLPHEVDGLPEMLREFSGLSSNLTEALSQTLGVLKRVTMKEMAIPKWKSSNKMKPTRTLEKLGLTLPFEMKGDFTGMLAGSDGELVYISEVIQSAYIDVDENGTEAGVVSAVLPGIGAGMCSAEDEFVADHPFVFMIVERDSKAVIFAGAVFNPLDEDEDEDEDEDDDEDEDEDEDED